MNRATFLTTFFFFLQIFFIPLMCYVFKSTLIHLTVRGAVHKVRFRDGNDSILLSSAHTCNAGYCLGALLRWCCCYFVFVESDKRKPRDDPLVRIHDHLASWLHQFKDNI
jgi:hypothetical protein